MCPYCYADFIYPEYMLDHCIFTHGMPCGGGKAGEYEFCPPCCWCGYDVSSMGGDIVRQCGLMGEHLLSCPHYLASILRNVEGEAGDWHEGD